MTTVLESRTDRAIVDMANSNPMFGRGPIDVRKEIDDEYMKKNGITEDSHVQYDFGLDIRDNMYVTEWRTS